jgi:sirohydrochlorin ferrochelatase
MLLELVDQFRRLARYGIVEPAHMELAEPSIDTAFDRCVAQGARLIVVFPHFLFPGRHWHADIPALAAAAASRHPGIRFLVAAPLGLHPLMLEVMDDRIQHCLRQSHGQEEACSVCREGHDRCRIQQSGPTAS